MRNLKLTLAYDGTRFVGWQRQSEGESIQGLLEAALSRFEGAPVVVHGAGRTDAGVHALGQVASAQVTCTHDTASITRGLNAQLPLDIRVTRVEEVAADFHARFSATTKTYRYLLRTSAVSNPFERMYVWHLSETLDLEAMRHASACLVGTHDFSAFQSTGSEPGTSVRTIRRSELVTWPDWFERDTPALLAYEIEGDGFLRHMVRAIVGTLVAIGRGWRTSSSMVALLGGAARADAGATAPAHGLFLVRVDYD